jgi:hypothetical protein
MAAIFRLRGEGRKAAASARSAATGAVHRADDVQPTAAIWDAPSKSHPRMVGSTANLRL